MGWHGASAAISEPRDEAGGIEADEQDGDRVGIGLASRRRAQSFGPQGVVALALAEQLEDGTTEYLIERALDEACSRQFRPATDRN